MDNVALRQEVVNIWIFVFPAKDNSIDWEASIEKPVQADNLYYVGQTDTTLRISQDFVLDFSQ